MKSTFSKLLLSFFLLFSVAFYSQESLKVIYFKNHVPKKIFKEKMDDELYEEYKEALHNQGDHYELKISKGKSCYLLKDKAKEIYVEKKVGLLTKGYVVYKNPINVYIDQKNSKLIKQYIFHDEAKKILVEDSLMTTEWELTDEIQTISGYKCRMAKGKYKRIKDQLKENDVFAWFTDEIPVNSGPEGFWGLPGLILKLQLGYQEVITAKKINFSGETYVLEPFQEGKKLSPEKFEKFVIEKFAPKPPIITRS